MRAYNILYKSGPWSPIRTITIDTTPPLPPILSLPVNNVPRTRVTPTFSWLASSGANAYQFQYDEAADFADPAYTSGVLTVKTHKPTLNMGLGTWYWRVMARDVAGNWSAWSTNRTITIMPPIPAAPVLDYPVTGTVTTNFQPVFAWYAVPYGSYYEFQIARLSTFASPLDEDRTVTELYAIPYPMSDGLKYWRVRAYNYANEPGPWSVVRSFTTYVSFNTQFNTNYNKEGWDSHPGASWEVYGGIFI